MSSATNTPVTAAAANPAANLTVAELQILAAPINQLFTDLQTPGVNYQTALQDFVKLQGALITDEPLAQTVGINNIAAFLQAKFNAGLASIDAKLEGTDASPAAGAQVGAIAVSTNVSST
jgi:hypothetical protein